MTICAKCRQEMMCLKTGVVVHYGGGHCYSGDRFGCPECGAEVISCSATPYQSEAIRNGTGHPSLEILEMVTVTDPIHYWPQSLMACPDSVVTAKSSDDRKEVTCPKCLENLSEASK